MNVEDIIKKHVKKSKIPGISVGLITETDTSVFNYGEIKKESGIEPTSDTLYEIGSMTKTFTAILAVKLQDEGLLSLQDPITKFLPEFEGTEFDEKNITLYHLITHTSGLIEMSLQKALPQSFSFMLSREKRIKWPKRYSCSNSDFLQEVLKMKLKKNPGTKFRYSNTGVGLVGQILERITNSTYEEQVKNRICDVLNMQDTQINILETHKDRLATGYLASGKKADYVNIPAIKSAGSICSTVSDMLKFLQANLGLSQSKLSPVLEYCQSTKINPNMSRLTNIILKLVVGVKLSRIGLGWIAYDLNGSEILWHNGGTEGFASLMMMDLEKKAGIVVLANRSIADHTKLGIALLN